MPANAEATGSRLYSGRATARFCVILSPICTETHIKLRQPHVDLAVDLAAGRGQPRLTAASLCGRVCPGTDQRRPDNDPIGGNYVT
jgi:hypothetical protein